MLILLPPSEGKAEPAVGGEPIDLDSLVFAVELGAKRRELSKAFDPGLLERPAAAAAEVYTGVLYQRLDLSSLSAAARRRAAKRVLISSALWGFVRPDDRIPYYRLPPSTKLDGIGGLAAWWREALAVALPDQTGATIVDMRSGAYSAMCKPTRANLLTVRAFRQEGRQRKAISHMAKAVRGDVTRALLLSKREAKNAEQVAAVATEAGFEVELTPSSLDVIVSD